MSDEEKVMKKGDDKVLTVFGAGNLLGVCLDQMFTTADMMDQWQEGHEQCAVGPRSKL